MCCNVLSALISASTSRPSRRKIEIEQHQVGTRRVGIRRLAAHKGQCGFPVTDHVEASGPRVGDTSRIMRTSPRSSSTNGTRLLKV
jgi:hypothetical protein